MRRILLLFLTVVLVATAAVPPPSNKLFRRRQAPGQYVDQITNFFSQHRWAKGKELLDQALELYPNEPNLHYLAGRYWWNGKNYDRSRYHLVKACQINYNQLDAKSLLVNVEEITGNYSSAICYVNELLEVNPYWKGLWQRKIELYKKLGNFEEANILLKRLSQIYPNDASLSGDYFQVLETTYQQARVAGDLATAEQALSDMVDMDPNDEEMQLALANILILRGKQEEAMVKLTAALNANPGNVPIIKKITDLHMGAGRTKAALNLVTEQMAEHPSTDLRALFNQLQDASALMESEIDPYQLYSRVYGQQHSTESLNYLLRESYRRGYDDDALYYIEEMRRKTGPSPRLTMQQYEVLRRKGLTEEANRTLEEGLVQFPDNYDLQLAVSRLRMEEASSLMREGLYSNAVTPLEFVRTQCPEPELQQTATRRLFNCYRETSRFDEAERMLQERLAFDPEYRVVQDRAAILVKQGRVRTAMDLLQGAYRSEKDSLARLSLGAAYVETAYPYLRERMQSGKFDGADQVCDQILAIEPDNYQALLYGIRVSPEPMTAVDRALATYPADVTFSIKKAQLLAAEGQTQEALSLLQPLIAEYPGDEDLQKAFAGVSDEYGNQLIKERNYVRAAEVLDFALAIQPDDKGLQYTRGLLYEKLREWDHAYVYQRNYVPSILEAREYLARMNAIRNKTLRNNVDVGGDIFRFADVDHIVGIASVGYTHAFKRNTLGFRANYTGRDAEVAESPKQVDVPVGGRGVQLQLQYGHDFGKRWSVEGDVAYGTAYFPRWAADASATLHLDWDLEAGANYRLMQDGGQMAGLFLNATHAWENFYAGAKVTGGLLYDILYVNASTRFRFYPYEGGRSFIEAQFGGGTAPEVTFLNYYYTTNVYNQLNSFVALSASCAITYNLAVQLSGTWNTLYDQRLTVKYRNLYLAHVSFTLSF